jgi:small-conductance mechanosensitive channel
MMTSLPQTFAQLRDWAEAGAVFLAAATSSLFVRHFALQAISRHLGQPESPSAIAFHALRLPSILWCVAASLTVTLQYSDLTGRAARWVAGGSFTFLVISICVVSSQLLVRIWTVSAARRGLRFAVSGVSRALIHVFVLLLGSTVLLRYFNITITPVLTALGVGGLAVALALRDTLANFFAGIHILVEAPLSIGDFIRLASGEEGTVTDIGWRTTRVLTGSNNVVVIPNERITSSILTNFALPDRKMTTEVAVLVSRDVDVSQVIRLAVEEARQVSNVRPDFDPVVLFDPGVTPIGLQFKLVVQINDRIQVGQVQSDLRLRLFQRFQRERVALPPVELPTPSTYANRD